ncbi:MAG: alpha-glucuronidase family glycosyl hydrolase [Dehalococcoidia bacterium]|nr:alpha-glucuronidase family glycosyl hydrolase [Dehalococcoidia bacterium]
MQHQNRLWSMATGVVVFAMLFMPAESPGLNAQPKPLPTRNISIVVPSSQQHDPALSLALDDLVTALAVAGIQGRLVADNQMEKLSAYDILIGDQRNSLVADLFRSEVLAPPTVADEGYVIKTVQRGQGPILVVSGKGELGSVYGVFNLVERLKFEPMALFRPMNVVTEPKVTLRLVSSPTPAGANYPGPEEALRWGYNAVAIEPWTRLPLYDDITPAILDPVSFPAERAWVEASRERARQQIQAAKRLHLKVFTMGDALSFPSSTLAAFTDEVSADDNPNLYCAAKPRARQLLEHAVDEVLSDFPDIDIIMVRTGENYIDGPITGNTPMDGACAANNDLSPNERLRMVLDIVRRQVVDVHGKTYIHRGWNLHDGGFHSDPEIMASVIEGIPTQGFMLSFKQTETDFWRYNAANPNIGRGNVSQMVEFQVAREFEGKGAFPNYLGEVFAFGGQEVKPAGGVKYATDRGVRAAWVWAKGGGWNGPQLQSDLWLDASQYAISHLLWNPDISPTALALQWASLRFGSKAAPKVASLLLKSDDAVLKGFYVEPYARLSGPWAPNNVWNRDDTIGGVAAVFPLYRASAAKNDFAIALADRKAALRIVDSMIDDFKAAMPSIPDKGLAQIAWSSLQYERSLFEVFDNYLTGIFQYYRWLDSGKSDGIARRSAIESLRNWETSWRRYNVDIPLLPGVASLYHDAGMSHTALAAMDDLQQ